jgi:alpha-L-fucosidase 2
LQTNLLWVLINMYNLYRATLDTSLLPPLYALLRASVNHQAHIAVKEADGKWHLPPTASPEYPVGCSNGCAGGDSTYHLSLFKWGLVTLPKLCALLQCDEPRHAVFDDMLQNLADFPVNTQLAVGRGRGLQISRGVVVNTSHRHYSHLLPCWNTGLLSWDDPVCVESLDNWHGG